MCAFWTVMAKLWDKGYDDDALIDKFTVGKDRELDLYLAQYDILGTMAHITMLSKVGLLPEENLNRMEDGPGTVLRAGKQSCFP